MSARTYKQWGPTVTLLNAVEVTTGTPTMGVDLTKEGWDGVHIQAYALFLDYPTDDLDFDVRSSVDGESFDGTPLTAVRLSRATDPNSISLIVKDVAWFRIFCKRSGSTSTIIVTAKYRPWRYGRSPV